MPCHRQHLNLLFILTTTSTVVKNSILYDLRNPIPKIPKVLSSLLLLMLFLSVSSLPIWHEQTQYQLFLKIILIFAQSYSLDMKHFSEIHGLKICFRWWWCYLGGWAKLRRKKYVTWARFLGSFLEVLFLSPFFGFLSPMKWETFYHTTLLHPSAWGHVPWTEPSETIDQSKCLLL